MQSISDFEILHCVQNEKLYLTSIRLSNKIYGVNKKEETILSFPVYIIGNYVNLVYRSMGFLAAVASSNLLITVVWGAVFTISGVFSASSAICLMTEMNSSSVSFHSVSVGSTINAS